EQLRSVAGVHIYPDRWVSTRASSKKIATVAAASVATSLVDGTAVSTPLDDIQTDYTIEVGAAELQSAGITGKGITIAVLDSGLWPDPAQKFGKRVLASIDVTNGGSGTATGDAYGHGTHVTSIAAGGASNVAKGNFGIAPGANLVIVRAFNGTGG